MAVIKNYFCNTRGVQVSRARPFQRQRLKSRWRQRACTSVTDTSVYVHLMYYHPFTYSPRERLHVNQKLNQDLIRNSALREIRSQLVLHY